MPWLLTLVLAFDLAAVKSEPNLERRSEKALDYAGQAFATARESYSSGDVKKSQDALQEVRQGVDLAYDSLSETGKDARRNPKFFKRAELKTRELLRRLDGMRQAVSIEDRALVESVRDHVSEIHDNLLKGIMSKKKK